MRASIEACLDEISDEPAVLSSTTTEENLGELLDNASQRAGDTRFEVGVVLAQHYRIAEVLGETSAGRTFRATDCETQHDVCVLVLHPQFVSDSAAVTVLDHEVEKLVGVRHANLLGIRAFETIDQASFVVMEWINGFSLLEVLRSRRELELDEVILLLRQASAGVDCAISSGLSGLAFDLRQVHLQFAEPPDKATLLRTYLSEWPSFELKLFPLAAALEPSFGQTWSGGQTMVGGSTNQSKATDLRPGYVQSLGAMVYELLGGARAPGARGGLASPIPRRYAPLATLSEEGNDVLKQALDPARSFPSATAFSQAFAALGGTQVRRHDLKTPSSAPVAPSTAPSTAPSRTPSSAPSAAPHRAPFNPPPTKTPSIVPSTRASIAPQQPPATTAKKKLPVVLISAVAATLLAVVAGVMFFHQGSAPPPPSTTQQTSPPVAPKPTPVPPTKMAQLVADAQHGDPLSMTLLGDSLRDQDQTDAAAKWYAAAAAKGYTPALTQQGVMLWNGSGAKPPDLAGAVRAFQAAQQKGDAAASLALGECYLSGQGVAAKDEKHALELFREAAQRGDLRAKNRLADCLVHGIGGKTDFTEALALFTESSTGGNLEALGNLGVLYINGQGVPANPKKGEELFENGARGGNSFCMSLLARCLENGVGIAKDATLAQDWYTKAAHAGDKRAVAWCQKHHIQ